MTDYRVRSSADLQAACAAAKPGDVIHVYGGLYGSASTIKGVRGDRDRPILIKAADRHWISGGTAPDPFWSAPPPPHLEAPGKPGDTDFAFLRIINCAFVVIDGLKIRECWPSILFVKNTDHLTVRNCVWRHGTYAIFAKGQGTSHLLIEDNEWQQDDSPNHLLWTTIDWAEAHGNEHSSGIHRYYNGGFFSSKDIRGNAVFRRNRIMDAYNGIRMKASDTPAERTPNNNANVYIFENEFIRIRDNPTEPEAWAYNWHVRHNTLIDCHSWFSFDGVTGGYWYYYGNTGSFTSRQGAQDALHHTMGRVLKLSYEQNPPEPALAAVPDFPWFVFNNSWHLRCPLIGGANARVPAPPVEDAGPDFTAQLDFFNNALAWCDPAQHGAWVCENIELVRHFDWARSRAVAFDYDICDRGDFLDYFRTPGRGEAHGTIATRPIFANTVDFPLAAGSEARRTGWVRGVARPKPGGGIELVALRAQDDGSLHRGSVQEYGPIEVPPLEAEAAALLAELRSMRVEPRPSG